jgi:hypothetical protein
MANTFKFGNGEWAVGKETALAYNDENSNFKPLPFTFDRASTATVVNKDGLIETVGVDEPRIDFLNNTKGALLLEPSRTNLVTYSEDFSQSVWQKNSVGSASAPIIASNFAVSPDGTQNATRVQFNISGSTSSDRSSLESVFALDGSSSYTLSFYIKSNTGVNQNLSVWLNSVYGNNITVTNEWVRVEQTFSSNSTFNRGFGLAASGNVQQSVDVLIFGFQLEQGSYATSYIPTSGSTATRSAETNEQTPPDGVIGQTEGTLFVQVGEFPKEHNGRIFAIGDGSADDYITIIKNGSNNNFAVYADAGGVGQVSYQGSGTLSNNSKIAVGYANNNYAIYVNGTQVHTATNASVPSLVKIFMGSRENGSSTFILGGSITETKLYNTRLSNTELQALTS